MERFFSIVITTILALTIYSPGGAEDQLSDLTGGVIPLVSFDPADALSPGGELYASGELTTRSDLRYSIRVKNQTGDPILASSLIIVVDKIVEVARGRDVTNQLEVFGHDGYTEEGKPFFRIPPGSSTELAPFAESHPVLVQIRNPDLLRLSTPILRVRGVRVDALQHIEELGRVLIPKGLLSPEEAADLLQSTASANQ